MPGTSTSASSWVLHHRPTGDYLVSPSAAVATAPALTPTASSSKSKSIQTATTFSSKATAAAHVAAMPDKADYDIKLVQFTVWS